MNPMNLLQTARCIIPTRTHHLTSARLIFFAGRLVISVRDHVGVFYCARLSRGNMPTKTTATVPSVQQPVLVCPLGSQVLAQSFPHLACLQGH
uniref:Sema domain-containing protein n=1 Tax=Mesocestoides corti TaxID=53468 RepID=A0A5K3ET16_MESCO